MDKNHIETERKFLVRSDAFIAASTGSHRIKQGYIAHDGGNTVRVRLWDDHAYLTIKGPGDPTGMSRFEWEKEIPVADAEALFALCHGKFIDKTRYIVPADEAFSGQSSPSSSQAAALTAAHSSAPAATYSGSGISSGTAASSSPAALSDSPSTSSLNFEVDVFYGSNQGLVMAEIELPSQDTPFPHPSWLGEEVTGDHRYYNSQLLDKPFSSWK